MKKGFFITLDGPDGCGKSTQSKLLAGCLKEKGYDVIHTREPGGTVFAENLRKIILNPKYKIMPMAELMLYEASRAQHTEEVIRPALKEKKIVICERYVDATSAYQGYGRGLNIAMIDRLNRIAAGGVMPDITLVLDICAKEGLERARKTRKKFSRGKGDRLERENSLFHERVRKGYLSIAKKNPKRIQIISAGGSVEQIHQNICSAVMKKIKSARITN